MVSARYGGLHPRVASPFSMQLRSRAVSPEISRQHKVFKAASFQVLKSRLQRAELHHERALRRQRYFGRCRGGAGFARLPWPLRYRAALREVRTKPVRFAYVSRALALGRQENEYRHPWPRSRGCARSTPHPVPSSTIDFPPFQLDLRAGQAAYRDGQAPWGSSAGSCAAATPCARRSRRDCAP